MENVYVVSAVRTAVGRSKAGSAIAHVRPDDLAAAAIGEAVKRSGIPAERIQDCVIGCAFPEAESGMNVGRMALLTAGCPTPFPVKRSTVSALPVWKPWRLQVPKLKPVCWMLLSQAAQNP